MRGVLGSPIGSRRYHGPLFSRAISLREAQSSRLGEHCRAGLGPARLSAANG